MKNDQKDLAKALESVLRPRVAAQYGSGQEKRPLTHSGTKTAIQAAESRRRQLDHLEDRLSSLLADTDDPLRKERLAAKIERVKAAREKLKADAGSPDRMTETLSERPYQPFRELTKKEQGVDMLSLNDRFNSLEGKIASDLATVSSPEIERMAEATRAAFTGADHAAASAVSFMALGPVRAILQEVSRRAYNYGRAMAANERAIARPPAPIERLKKLNVAVDHLSDLFSQQLTMRARTAATDALTTDASPAGGIAHVRAALTDEAGKMIQNLASSIVGQYINQGRGDVFDDAEEGTIVSYTRSEVLDNVTCDMCLSLDLRTVAPDDPFLNLDLVHNNCRGIWIPNYAGDEQMPEIAKLPKEITSKFETVDGSPVMNAYTSLKKALPNSHGAAREAARREDKRGIKSSIRAAGAKYFRNVPLAKLKTQAGEPIAQHQGRREAIDGIKDILQKGGDIPMIEVEREKDGTYVVTDGRQRAKAAQELGRDTIEAVVKKKRPVKR